MERPLLFTLVLAGACTIGEGGPVADAPSPPIRVPAGAQPIAVTSDRSGSVAALRGLEERVEHALVGAGVRVVTRDRLSVADQEARRQLSPRYAPDGAVALGRLLGARAVGVVSIEDLRVDTRVHILTRHHYGSLSTSFTLIDVETGEILLARRSTIRVDRRATEVSSHDVEEMMLDAAVERLVGARRI